MSSVPTSTAPTDDEALQFCIMLSAGLPATDAIRYFVESDDQGVVLATLKRWQAARSVRRAQLTLLGKSWTEMSLDERIDTGLAQHYNNLAYVLFSENYLESNPAIKAKLDTARAALEAKKAGTAGKGDALSVFFEDLKSGKLKLTPPAPRPN